MIEKNKHEYLKDFYPNSEIKYQSRIGGCCAERLLNIFVKWKGLKVKCVDIVYTEEKYKERKPLIEGAYPSGDPRLGCWSFAPVAWSKRPTFKREQPCYYLGLSRYAESPCSPTLHDGNRAEGGRNRP